MVARGRQAGASTWQLGGGGSDDSGPMVVVVVVSMVRMVVVAVQGLLAPCPDRSFRPCLRGSSFALFGSVECSWWIGSARVSGRSEVEAVCLCERV